MNGFLSNLWALFTNDGMYSTGEKVVILVVSAAIAIAIMLYNGRRAEMDQRNEMIAELGNEAYLDYLKWKATLEEMRK